MLHLPKRTKFREFPYGKPKRRLPTVLDNLPKGKKTERLSLALANDNGGTWYLAVSSLRVEAIERLFQTMRVPRILYDRIGALLQGPEGYMYVQIALKDAIIDQRSPDSDEWEWREVPLTEPSWSVKLALNDAGVFLMQPCDIAQVLRSGVY